MSASASDEPPFRYILSLAISMLAMLFVAGTLLTVMLLYCYIYYWPFPCNFCLSVTGVCITLGSLLFAVL